MEVRIRLQKSREVREQALQLPGGSPSAGTLPVREGTWRFSGIMTRPRNRRSCPSSTEKIEQWIKRGARMSDDRSLARKEKI